MRFVLMARRVCAGGSRRWHFFRCARAAMWAVALWHCCLSAAFAYEKPDAVMQVAPVGPSVFGTRLTFYAHLSSPTQNGPEPTGTITFAYRNAPTTFVDICSLTIDTNNYLQTCQAPIGLNLSAGSHPIILIYSGDSNYYGSVALGLGEAWRGALAEENYVFTKQTPTISLKPPAPVFVGQYAALELIIDNATQTTGSFAANIGGGNGGCLMDANIQHVCAVKTYHAGTYTVDAGFTGDANHNLVFNAPVGQITILPAATTLTIVAPAPIMLGDAASIKIVLKSLLDPDANFTGTIVISDGEASCQVQFASPMPGYAGCALAPISAGVRHLTATYGGSDDHSPSTGTADLTVVGPKIDGACGSDNGKTLASPPANLCSAGAPSIVAGSGPWTWSCAGSNGGATANCAANLAPSPRYAIAVAVDPPGSGTATCTPNPVASGGSSTCTATANAGYAFGAFSGDCSGATCTLNNVSANKTVTANFTATSTKTATMTVLTLAPNPAQIKQPINASVTVSSVSAPTGKVFAAGSIAAPAAAGGSVTVSAGAVNCTATLVNGSGVCSLSFANPGAYAVSASYAGDANYAASSDTENLIVTAAVSAQTVTAPALDRWAMLLLAVSLGILVWRRSTRQSRQR